MKKNLFFFLMVSLCLFGASSFAAESPYHNKPLTLQKNHKTTPSLAPHALDLKEVFNASPIIYSILLSLSIGAFSLWLFTLTSLRKKDYLAKDVALQLRSFLSQKNYDDALLYCHQNDTLLSKMIKTALTARNHGPQFMIDSMKAEGKRATAHYWQKISLLNDIILVAPMLGLLGTVLGMFYAFYDMNRSIETIVSIFDGLGLAIGATVAGLIVAILSVIFYTTLKHRLFRILNLVENEALSLTSFIEIPSQTKE